MLFTCRFVFDNIQQFFPKKKEIIPYRCHSNPFLLSRIEWVTNLSRKEKKSNEIINIEYKQKFSHGPYTHTHTTRKICPIRIHIYIDRYNITFYFCCDLFSSSTFWFLFRKQYRTESFYRRRRFFRSYVLLKKMWFFLRLKTTKESMPFAIKCFMTTFIRIGLWTMWKASWTWRLECVCGKYTEIVCFVWHFCVKVSM